MRLRTGTWHAASVPALAAMAVLPLLETASAQNVTPPKVTPPAVGALTFEVASVKVQTPLGRPGESLQGSLARIPFRTFRGGRFKAANATARWLILEAYGGEYRLREQVVGGPGWLDQDQFEIDAVVRVGESSGTDSAPPDAVLEMLRNLLQTRFKLRVTPQMREGPVYALVRARRDGRLGAGIRVSEKDCTGMEKDRDNGRNPRLECFPQYGDDGLRRVGNAMERFAEWLERRVGRTVINETGLSGPVDLFFPWSTASNFTDLNRIGADSELFTALEDVMGLRLESRRAPIPVLVVEHMERPTEN